MFAFIIFLVLCHSGHKVTHTHTRNYLNQLLYNMHIRNSRGHMLHKVGYINSNGSTEHGTQAKYEALWGILHDVENKIHY